MVTHFATRAANFLAALFAASVVIFVILDILPGDPAQLMLGIDATEDAVEALRREMGLDRPAPERYADWILGVLQGDFGRSLTYDVPVGDLIAERLAVTVPLALIAFAMTVAISLPLGILAAVNRNRPGDYAVMGFSQIGLSVPNFWFGILLILLFAVQLRWVPAGGFPGWEAGAASALAALVLPATALALSEVAILSRVVRAATLDCYAEDYVRTARAKGLSRSAVLTRHVMRNMMLPVVTLMGLQFAFLVAGSVIIENVFYLPGLGRLLLQAIFQRDLIVVQNVVLLLAGFVVLANFVVDLLVSLIDPRPRAAP